MAASTCTCNSPLPAWLKAMFTESYKAMMMMILAMMMMMTTMMCVCRLDSGYIDLYLIHSPAEGRVLESYKAMMEFQQQGLVK